MSEICHEGSNQKKEIKLQGQKLKKKNTGLITKNDLYYRSKALLIL